MLLRRTAYFLKIAVLCDFLASSSLLLIPMCTSSGNERMSVFSYMIAGTFWGGLILAQVFFWIANAGKRRLQKRGHRRENLPGKKPGIITFGANLEALVCDIVCGVSLVTVILLIYNRVQNPWLDTASLAILVFSLNLHCILNGETYAFIKSVYKFKKERRGNERVGK